MDIDDALGTDILRGAAAIATYLNESQRRVFYLAERQMLPIGRLGSTLVASKRRLREHYDRLTQGAEPQAPPRLSRQLAPPRGGQRRDRAKGSPRAGAE
jgi:hypothetical protein